MGKHDKQRKAISGTSNAGGMKALWQWELPSNTGSLIEPTLDLITTRRREQFGSEIQGREASEHMCA